MFTISICTATADCTETPWSDILNCNYISYCSRLLLQYAITAVRYHCSTLYSRIKVYFSFCSRTNSKQTLEQISYYENSRKGGIEEKEGVVHPPPFHVNHNSCLRLLTQKRLNLISRLWILWNKLWLLLKINQYQPFKKKKW